MAVYTSINKETLTSFLDSYDIGLLENFEGILEGVENTNYKIKTSCDLYILTIFEKRINKHELPFFIELQNHLSNKNIKCPHPIADRSGQFINTIRNKPCVIMSFLSGKKIDNPNAHHCYQVGEQLANMHQHTEDFTLIRDNNLHQSHWRNIFEKCQESQDNQYNELFDSIKKELQYLDKNWPTDLPKGVIHADVFQDNVFFIKNTLSGLIDFYFACNDFYAYELAISINAWCFDNKGIFDQGKCEAILKGYQKIRTLSNKELDNLTILLRGASMRILLTRLHDQLFHSSEAYVTPKDPMEYFAILKYFQNNTILNKKIHGN